MKSNDKKSKQKQTKQQFYILQGQFKYYLHQYLIQLNEQIKRIVRNYLKNLVDRNTIKNYYDGITKKIAVIKAILCQQLTFLQQSLHKINFNQYEADIKIHLKKFFSKLGNENGKNLYYLSQFSKIEEDSIFLHYQQKLQGLNRVLVQTQSRVIQIAQEAQTSTFNYKKQQQRLLKSKRYKKKSQIKKLDSHILLEKCIQTKLIDYLKFISKISNNKLAIQSRKKIFGNFYQRKQAMRDMDDHEALISLLIRGKQLNLSQRQAKIAYQRHKLKRSYSQNDLTTYLGSSSLQEDIIKDQRKYSIDPHRQYYIRKALQKIKTSLQRSNAKLQAQNNLFKIAIEKANQDKVLKTLRKSHMIEETAICLSPRKRKYFFQREEDFNYEKSLILLELESERLNKNYLQALDTLKYKRNKVSKDDSKIFTIRQQHHRSINAFFMRKKNKSLTEFQVIQLSGQLEKINIPQVTAQKCISHEYVAKNNKICKEEFQKNKPIRSQSTIGNENSRVNNSQI